MPNIEDDESSTIQANVIIAKRLLRAVVLGVYGIRAGAVCKADMEA